MHCLRFFRVDHLRHTLFQWTLNYANYPAIASIHVLTIFHLYLFTWYPWINTESIQTNYALYNHIDTMAAHPWRKRKESGFTKHGYFKSHRLFATTIQFHFGQIDIQTSQKAIGHHQLLAYTRTHIWRQ